MSLPILARWLRRPLIAALVIVAGGLLAPEPLQAQSYPYVDCNNPYYYQYCQAYSAWYSQYYAPCGYGYGYADPYSSPYYPYYPSYGYGVPAALGLGFGFHRFHPHH